MTKSAQRAICWTPLTQGATPGPGLEHLMLDAMSADSVILGVDEDQGPFRLAYQLQWTKRWQLQSAVLTLTTAGSVRTLQMRTDGQGQWWDGRGRLMAEVAGCLDIDIWPTPFTNTFALRRQPLAIGERRCFTMAWVFGPTLRIQAQAQAYTRLKDRLYLFESLDGSGFHAELAVDDECIVIDYPGLFRRLPVCGAAPPGNDVAHGPF